MEVQVPGELRTELRCYVFGVDGIVKDRWNLVSVLRDVRSSISRVVLPLNGSLFFTFTSRNAPPARNTRVRRMERRFNVLRENA